MTNSVINDQFFAPVSMDLIDRIMVEYNQEKINLEAIHEMMSDKNLHHFVNGNVRNHLNVNELFSISGAIDSLTACYWRKVFNLTDIYNYLPACRRKKWDTQLSAWRDDSSYVKGKYPDNDLVEFNEDTVRTTIISLMNSREQFFAEKIDDAFKALSGEHVTNRPEAFGTRMIFAGKADHINDLRSVIAKFFGRDEPHYDSSNYVINYALRRHGEWVNIDGGSLRMRAYLKGTIHLEVHPDIAWRLNSILASIYPLAIPPKFRQPTKKPKKSVFQVIQRPLPFKVIALLHRMERVETNYYDNYARKTREGVTSNPNSLRFSCYDAHGTDKHILNEAEKIIEMIGGIKMSKGAYIWYEFDYVPADVITEIVAMGCIPDQKTHQYYPTPKPLALRCVELVNIQHDDECLEPSAGMGNIAGFMPVETTTCIDISALYCKALESKGYKAIHADFIEWAKTAPKFDKIVMNPPFSEGRAKAHVEAAAELLNRNGRLVAILPASMRGKDILPGFAITWSDEICNEFAGTSISVVILTADKAVN